MESIISFICSHVLLAVEKATSIVRLGDQAGEDNVCTQTSSPKNVGLHDVSTRDA